MGFQVAEGPEIEDDFHNFGALNIPRRSPGARHAGHVLRRRRRRLLLRTHTSPVQIRVHARDAAAAPRRRAGHASTAATTPTATHSPMFQQIEGFMVDERVTFADLKGVLVHFLRRLFGPRRAVRFRPSFFPFTEP